MGGFRLVRQATGDRRQSSWHVIIHVRIGGCGRRKVKAAKKEAGAEEEARVRADTEIKARAGLVERPRTEQAKR